MYFKIVLLTWDKHIQMKFCKFLVGPQQVVFVLSKICIFFFVDYYLECKKGMDSQECIDGLSL